MNGLTTAARSAVSGTLITGGIGSKRCSQESYSPVVKLSDREARSKAMVMKCDASSRLFVGNGKPLVIKGDGASAFFRVKTTADKNMMIY